MQNKFSRQMQNKIVKSYSRSYKCSTYLSTFGNIVSIFVKRGYPIMIRLFSNIAAPFWVPFYTSIYLIIMKRKIRILDHVQRKRNFVHAVNFCISTRLLIKKIRGLCKFREFYSEWLPPPPSLKDQHELLKDYCKRNLYDLHGVQKG